MSTDLGIGKATLETVGLAKALPNTHLCLRLQSLADQVGRRVKGGVTGAEKKTRKLLRKMDPRVLTEMIHKYTSDHVSSHLLQTRG